VPAQRDLVYLGKKQSCKPETAKILNKREKPSTVEKGQESSRTERRQQMEKKAREGVLEKKNFRQRGENEDDSTLEK